MTGWLCQELAEDARALVAHRQEEPELPADDLADEALGLEARHVVGVEAGELDARGVHDGDAAQHKTARERKAAALGERRPGFIGRERRVAGGEGVNELRRNEAADHALAVIRLEAVDARVVLGQLLPDGEQQAGHEMEPALREFRHGLQLARPQLGERRSVGLAPLRVGERGIRRWLGRSMGRTRRTRRSMVPSSSVRLGAGSCTAARCGLAVGEENAAVRPGELQRFRERERLVAVLARDLVEPGLRAGRAAWRSVRRVGDHEAFGADGLKAHLVGAGRDGAFDLRFEQFLERGEDRVLQDRSPAPASG